MYISILYIYNIYIHTWWIYNKYITVTMCGIMKYTDTSYYYAFCLIMYDDVNIIIIIIIIVIYTLYITKYVEIWSCITYSTYSTYLYIIIQRMGTTWTYWWDGMCLLLSCDASMELQWFTVIINSSPPHLFSKNIKWTFGTPSPPVVMGCSERTMGSKDRALCQYRWIIPDVDFFLTFFSNSHMFRHWIPQIDVFARIGVLRNACYRRK